MLGQWQANVTQEMIVNIGAGRPPVPLRLAQRIESGVFIEMADLLPERLGDKERGHHRGKHSKRSLSILEWVQCFSTYVAVVAR